MSAVHSSTQQLPTVDTPDLQLTQGVFVANQRTDSSLQDVGQGLEGGASPPGNGWQSLPWCMRLSGQG